MSVAACAALVERGDPERFLATMAAPVAARRVLFPIYAYALEVARAPWVTAEPMIAEMRLQFWRDVAEGIGQGATPRAHEVALPLARILGPEDAGLVDRIATARRWDIHKDAFEDQAAFDAYLDDTAAAVMWLAAKTLGAPTTAEPVFRDIGWATGLARYLVAVPALEAAGRIPLLDGRAQAVRALAATGLDRLRVGLSSRLAGPSRAALNEAVAAGPILRQAVTDPHRVGAGALALSPFRLRWRLLRGALA